MKLRALRLHGFKSFADRTEIAFNDGITAIVGPNGCGKSNISDAIRWVLGEQRPTAIRGGKMEEAIFQGTVNRRSVNRGSVSIEVSNEDGALALPFGVVEIARTVYRDGGSDYYLNRAACRLRDVQDACRDTGLGANAYAIIENRMIDAILSDRAEERRSLFEEAAGIGKYRNRRSEASRGLERAEVDLQRLEDVIGEVSTKVRSLARQKGKAERFRALRSRRFDVEVTLARRRIEAHRIRLEEVRAGLSGDEERAASLRAQVETSALRLEAIRVEQLEGEQARAAAGGEVDRLRLEVVRWERETAVAEQGAAHARRRIEQIGVERSGVAGLLEEAGTRMSELAAEGAVRALELKGLMERLGVGDARSREAREGVRTARSELEKVEAEAQRSARRLAHLQGKADAAEARGAELTDRLLELARELEEARAAVGQIASEGKLFAHRLAGLEGDVRLGEGRLEACREEEERARAAVKQARDGEMRARELYGTLSARRSALEGMERNREGVGPAVRALLSDPPVGVLGILADFVTAEPGLARAVEAALGVRLRGVVVHDTRAAVRVAEWFREVWNGAGGLLLLPLDRVPAGEASGSLLGKVTVTGEGGPWVRALLREFELGALPGAPFGEGQGAARVLEDGSLVDREGVVHVGNPLGVGGLLERKERLLALEAEVGQAKVCLEEAVVVREEVAAALALREEALVGARGALERAGDAYRAARSEQAAGEDRLLSTRRLVGELESRHASARDALARTGEIADGPRQERAALLVAEQRHRARREAARTECHRAEDRWEEVRGAYSRLAIERARLEGEIGRNRERESEIAHQKANLEVRVRELEVEVEKLRMDQERAESILAEGSGETGRLFGALETLGAELRRRDRELEEIHVRVADAERRVREVRTAERAAVDERHRFELAEQEVRGRIGRIRDRLETEWGRSLERLLEEAGEVEAGDAELRDELVEILHAFERMGPVNMLAVEEHEEECARLAFLTGQRDDLVEARDDLRSAIRQINKTAVELFFETFSAIRMNFRDTFLRLFERGECDLRLRTPDDPLESAIDIHAAPRGKRTQSIDLLSGGERALTALALLFAIYLVKPSPFCVLDEVDAPLDEANVERFVALLNDFKAETQFVVITHNLRTIEAADWIYGVTMEEPGVSSIVGVRLDDALGVGSYPLAPSRAV